MPLMPSPRRSSPPRHRRDDEQMIHGLHACEAVFARRPEAIIRAYFTADRRRQLGPLVAWCAQHRRGYQLVEAESLAKLAGTRHHEGVAILAKAVPRWRETDLVAAIEKGSLAGPLLLLDGIENPHNLGSILRTAAHFGVGAILGKSGRLPPLSAAAIRVAEGAAEVVPLAELARPASSLVRLRKHGFRLVATSSHHGEPPEFAGLDRNCLVMLGGEHAGVSPSLEAEAETTLRIGGSGAVESLNVAVACGIVLAEACRGQPAAASSGSASRRRRRLGRSGGSAEPPP